MYREGDGCRRMDRHLARLAESAAYFGYPFNRQQAVVLLESLPPTAEPQRLRLTLTSAGGLEATVAGIAGEKCPLTIGLAAIRVDPGDRLLYHKTDCRQWREAERQRRPDCDELLFVNNRGELTEGSYNNIVLRLGDRLLTPPLESGLLPGVLRGEMLASGEISEQVLYPRDLALAGEIWLVNSLRGLRRAVLAEGEKV
jgi:branched-subunit amino acid aminotransferase/4-amino-4-deoxychorismate lyase